MSTDVRPGRSAITRRLFGFGALPFISAAAPFLFLPVLARTGGSQAWIAIAVGQSIGGFFALIVAQGINLTGPTIVARTTPVDRPEVFRLALQSRMALFLPSSAIAGITAWLISPDEQRYTGALMAVAATFTGLSSAWYMIGLGKPLLIALYETVPKVLATAGATSIALSSGNVAWYPILIITASVLGLGAFTFQVSDASKLFQVNRTELFRAFRAQWSAMASEVTGGAYVSLTVSFVALATTPFQSAVYVSGDKLYKLGQFAIAALGNALQGWVSEKSGKAFERRATRSLLAHLVLGILGFVIFAFFGNQISALLFGDSVAIGADTSLGFAVATLALAVNTSLGRNILVPMNARSEIFIGIAIGAVIGVPLIFFLSSSAGAAGGAWGLAISEAAVSIIQGLFVLRKYQNRRQH